MKLIMLYKNTLRIGLVLMLIAPVLICCKKQEPGCDPPWYVEIAPPLKDYLFAPGSYWIYKNDGTGVEDSVVLLELEDTIWREHPPVNPYADNRFRQMCMYYCYSSLRNVFFQELIYEDFIRRVDVYELGGGEQGLYVYRTNPYVALAFEYVELLSSMEVAGESYNQVRHFKTKGYSGNSSAFRYDTETFYSPKTGLIKWVEHDSINGPQSFSLLRKQVQFYTLKQRCRYGE